jgi:hypothetical protein
MQLVCLTDLENDFINPFDLSSKMNRFVVSTKHNPHICRSCWAVTVAGCWAVTVAAGLGQFAPYLQPAAALGSSSASGASA